MIRAAVAGGGLAIVLILATALASGPIDTRLFNGDAVMLWAFIAGLVAYCIEHLARGTLAGNGRFRPYGLLLGTEGVLRVFLCTLLAVAGAKLAGLFGFSLVIASYAAVAIALAGRRGLLRAGPPASWRELSRALGFLLVSSVLTQFLLSIGTVGSPAARPGFTAGRGRAIPDLANPRVHPRSFCSRPCKHRCCPSSQRWPRPAITASFARCSSSCCCS